MSTPIGAVARTEIARLFRSPLAWLVLALGELLMAVAFLLFVLRYIDNQADLRAAGVSVEVVMRYFGVAELCVLVMAPLLTMGTFAADRRDGMLRFLFSLPLSAGALVGGKLAGAASLLGAWVVLVSLLPLTLLWGAPIDLGVLGANVVGLALCAAFHLALGVLASAITRAPVQAALLALLVSFALWVAEWAARLDAEAAAVAGWSTLARLRGFSQGLVVSADLAWFVMLTLACFALAVVAIDAERRLA